MYLYYFFTSLKLLQSDAVPEYPKITELGNTIYWGVESGDKLLNIDKINGINTKNKYMIITEFSSLTPHITDVTQLENYISDLKNESEISQVIRSVPESFAHAIIYEAVWIIDLIYTLDHRKMFLSQFDGGLPQLNALLNNNMDEGSPVFDSFKYPLAKDIFLAQSMYFIVKYCNCRLINYCIEFFESLPKVPAGSNHIADSGAFFDKLLTEIVKEYYENTPCGNWKVKIQTGVDNPELDFFLQQIYLLSQKTEE